MRFKYLREAEVKLENCDLIYDKGYGLLGYIKNSEGNVYSPVDLVGVPIKDLSEKTVKVNLVVDVEPEVRGRWISFKEWLDQDFKKRHPETIEE